MRANALFERSLAVFEDSIMGNHGDSDAVLLITTCAVQFAKRQAPQSRS